MDNESTITAPTLLELMDKLDAATPPGKVAVVREFKPSSEGWSLEYTLKDRL